MMDARNRTRQVPAGSRCTWHGHLARDPRPGRPCHARRSGFTLIEILVVVAIIALLIAILMPALAQVRRRSQQVVCMTKLKEFGTATAMYIGEHKDTLPGPCHWGVELEASTLDTPGEYDEWHLLWFIRKYFSEKARSKGQLTDEMAKCPTAVRLSSTKLKHTGPASASLRPFSYSLNNWAKASSTSGTIQFETKPPAYFGAPDHYWTAASRPPRLIPLPVIEDFARPKKLNVIKQLAREWAMGDAFIRKVPLLLTDMPGRPRGDWMRGTYQWPSALDRIPNEPYHQGGINVAMFDGHAEWQRPWRGSINPGP